MTVSESDSTDDMDIVHPARTSEEQGGVSTHVQMPDKGKATEVIERTSVFDRLSSDTVDGRLKFTEKEKRRNFADVVGGKNASVLEFFPLADKTQTQIRIPIELAKQAAKVYHSTLFGYFLGPRIPFPVVKRFACNAWAKFGFVDAMLNSNGGYFFKFNDAGGANQVLEQGHVFIQGVPFFLCPWDPSKGMTKPEHNSCPLWVKLTNIPLVAFNKEGISRIASALGVPKQMDACTASMCDKAWGRPAFAKVLIEVWAVGSLKRNLEIIVPSISGGDDVKATIGVEYLWEPAQCSHCLVFGHKISSCPKAIHTKPISKPVVKDGDGFQLVQKKQWRPKARSNGEGSSKDGECVSMEPPVVTMDLGGLFRKVRHLTRPILRSRLLIRPPPFQRWMLSLKMKWKCPMM
ncbi:hypothetical protein OSB04_un000085 [Centaurea solstitialis]|uniref:DUF4283 domain-containing protein n=1 Tax=Centaurea solstitialis TaxID=347529 RepID=A0AA38S5Q2_9ASTR|nr:hypothetical protein OSB04_un000085 [Centaurea solstitialis]